MTKELTAMIADVRAELEKQIADSAYMTNGSFDIDEGLTKALATLDKIAAAVEGNSYKHGGFVSIQGEDVYKPAEVVEGVGVCVSAGNDKSACLSKTGDSKRQPTPTAEMDEYSKAFMDSLKFGIGFTKDMKHIPFEHVINPPPAEMDEVRAISLMAGAMREDLPSSSVFNPFDPTGAKWAEAVTTSQAEKAFQALKQIATITPKPTTTSEDK